MISNRVELTPVIAQVPVGPRVVWFVSGEGSTQRELAAQGNVELDVRAQGSLEMASDGKFWLMHVRIWSGGGLEVLAP